jgi:hypothetical protein
VNEKRRRSSRAPILITPRPTDMKAASSLISMFRLRKSASLSHGGKKVFGILSDFARLTRFYRRRNSESATRGALSAGANAMTSVQRYACRSWLSIP